MLYPALLHLLALLAAAESEGSANTAHIALACAAAVPGLMVIGMWIDWRRTKQRERKEGILRHEAERRERDRRYIEDRLLADERHHTNDKRLVAIETKMEPIVDWWNTVRNGDSKR